ncbi:MAG: transposase, partial [Desulfobulbaceae bacterium]|nr:transposase [Desulfobulbaceae bacterium]
MELVTESLVKGNNPRQADWTESIAVGSRKFVETIKENLGLRAKGRKILES